jgi:hypothetical protein
MVVRVHRRPRGGRDESGRPGGVGAAGEWFVEIAAWRDVAAQWGGVSALAGSTVGGFVGHTAAAVSRLGPLLDTTPDSDVSVWSVADDLAPFPVRTAEDVDGPLHEYGRVQGERGDQRGPKETLARLQTRLDELGDRGSGPPH